MSRRFAKMRSTGSGNAIASSFDVDGGHIPGPARHDSPASVAVSRFTTLPSRLIRFRSPRTAATPAIPAFLGLATMADPLHWDSAREVAMRMNSVLRLCTWPCLAAIAPFLFVACGDPSDIDTGPPSDHDPAADVGASRIPGNPDAGTPTNGGADAGVSTTGNAGSPSYGDFCVTAPWTDSPAQFVTADGATMLPAGTYTLRYMGGAQSMAVPTARRPTQTEATSQG